jgi:hypothetical protein
VRLSYCFISIIRWLRGQDLAYAERVHECPNDSTCILRRLVPKRCTAIIVEGVPGLDTRAMPTVDFTATDAYFKLEGDRIMASLGDQGPVESPDIQSNEWEIAVLAEWLQRETRLSVKRTGHSWAGLACAHSCRMLTRSSALTTPCRISSGLQRKVATGSYWHRHWGEQLLPWPCITICRSS